VEIFWLDEVDSTQRYLLDGLKNQTLKPPVCVGTTLQTNGRGSRGNQWIGEEGNFFISFAIKRKMLPDDLRLESSSIYFAYLLKELLSEMGSKVWLKWPNDFYFGEQKVGGLITNLAGDCLVCGIGLNLQRAPENFAVMDIEIEPKELMDTYIDRLKTFPSWKQIFSKFALEFERSKSFLTHFNNVTIELKDAILCEDGSLECNGQRMYSLR
jgi:BirA family biotin operon repressor/biotin-[acetyl-CoA-carboxylase] ligase